jgi:hypothetical protein
MNPYWIREAQKHMDPTGPDPQHWFNDSATKSEFVSGRRLWMPVSQITSLTLRNPLFSRTMR